MRLIDADALMGVVTKNSYMLRSEHNTTDYGMFLSGIKQAVDEAPAVDAAPVVHARWIICSDGYYPYCSACKAEPRSGALTNYCPNCGAKMDGKDDNE